MGPDWKTCPQCNLMIPPPLDNNEIKVCPGCGSALVPVAAEFVEPLWFYAQNKKKKGPVTLAELAELLTAATIGPATLVRRIEATKWRRVEDVRELRPPTQAAAPPPTAPGMFVARHQRRPVELMASLLIVVVVTILYILAAQGGLPRPSGFLGHSLGIMGFSLMICAETLYSLRKRSSVLRGRTSVWLQVHIVMGIVGPYLVLLHSAGRFQGVAGLVMLMTVLVVISGFVGRYIYTAVPRTHDGAVLAVRALEDELNRDAAELQELGLNRLKPEALAEATARPPHGWPLIFARPWLARRQRSRIRRALKSFREVDQNQAKRIENVLMDRYQLLIMVQSLPLTRRMMAIWHMVHVPMGVAMFTLAVFHVVGALYFSTFMR